MIPRKLLTYSGFYDNPYFMRREIWYKGKLMEWMTADAVEQIRVDPFFHNALPHWGYYRGHREVSK